MQCLRRCRCWCRHHPIWSHIFGQFTKIHCAMKFPQTNRFQYFFSDYSLQICGRRFLFSSSSQFCGTISYCSGNCEINSDRYHLICNWKKQLSSKFMQKFRSITHYIQLRLSNRLITIPINDQSDLATKQKLNSLKFGLCVARNQFKWGIYRNDLVFIIGFSVCVYFFSFIIIW